MDINNWRTEILKEFTPKVARLTIALDPDGLLLEEIMLKEIRDRGFEMLPFEDRIAFRFAYESVFRQRWDAGEDTDLVVVLRSDTNDVNSIPFDLLQVGRLLAFKLTDVFPNLSYPVVAKLDRADLDLIYNAQLLHHPSNLGDNATKDFALLHVYQISPDLVREPQEFLHVLLKCFSKHSSLPGILSDRFIQVLRQKQLFNDWPLEEIVKKRSSFYAFLQERWGVFVEYETGGTSSIIETCSMSEFRFEGPRLLPFHHDDVRSYVSTLFLDGALRRVAIASQNQYSNQWIAIGVEKNSREDYVRRIDRLAEDIERSLPTIGARHTEWISIAYKWAQVKVLSIESGEGSGGHEVQTRIEELTRRIDVVFNEWLIQRYASLHNLPPAPPAMVHHIPRALAHIVHDDPLEKIALIVIDGLSIDQWLVMRRVLQGQLEEFLFEEDAAFAWLPTFTSISRQAILAGKEPFYFPNSIYSTDKEQTLWVQFWVDRSIPVNSVYYRKGLGDEMTDGVEEELSTGHFRAVALVVNTVDRIMHGMQLGTAGMHNQVRQWSEMGFMKSLISMLTKKGYRIFLTSDHGNIEARGVGKVSEGAIVDLRGQRARLYSSVNLLDEVKDSILGTSTWPGVGLPTGLFVLMAPYRSAFAANGEKVVVHGGNSIEETIVPFISISKTK